MKRTIVKQFLLLFIMLLFNGITVFSQVLSPKNKPENGKWGYVDESGKWVVKAKYTHAYPFKYGVGCVEKDGKIGFVNEKGKEILKCRFEKDAVVSKDYIFVKDANLSSTFYMYDLNRRSKRSCMIKDKKETKKGVTIIEVDFESLDPTSSYITYREEKNFFVIDKDGNVGQVALDKNFRNQTSLYYKQFEDFSFFSNGNLYSPSGKHILNFEGGNNLSYMSEGNLGSIVRVAGNGYFFVQGYLGNDPKQLGLWLVSPEDSVYSVPESLNKFLLPGTCFIYNPAGGYKMFYNNMTESDTYEAVEKEEYDRYEAYKAFKRIISGAYSSEVGYKLYKNGEWDYLYEGSKIDLALKGSREDADNLKMIVASWTQRRPFFAIKNENGKFDLYDPIEKTAVVSDCDSIKYLCDDFAACYQGGYVSLFSANKNKVVVPSGRYSYIASFHDVFWVEENGKRGMMSKESCKLLIPCVYDRLYSKTNSSYATEGDKELDYVYAKKDGKMGILDRKTGKEIVPCRYASVQQEYGLGDIFRVSNDDKAFGLFHKGKMILPIKEYSSRYDYENTHFVYNLLFGIFVWDKNDKVGAVDYDGRQIVPFAFDGYEVGRNVIFYAQKPGKVIWTVYSLVTKKVVISKTFNPADEWGMTRFCASYL